jgi:hypothetical protein
LISVVRVYAPSASSANLERLLQSALMTPDADPAARRERWSVVSMDADGGEVSFRSDRLDPESGKPLQYLFKVEDHGRRIHGLNLAARAVLREP